MEKDLNYYLNIEWSLIHGTDLDFNGNTYSYIEIKELPSFAYCGKTQEIALANYKRQLKLYLQVMIENGDKIYEPGELPEDEVVEEDDF